MNRLKVLVLLVVLVSLIAVPSTMARKDVSGSERVLVHFAPGQKAGVRDALIRSNGQIHLELDKHNVIAVTLPTAAINGISHNPNVTLVEVDAIRTPSAVALDSLIEPQVEPYGISMVQAPEMWAEGYKGEGVVVCIIDTGLYADHEDLVDATVLGGSSIANVVWDYDGYGHGTHVAGTIAGQDNGVGVVGVSPDASLYIYKIFDDAGEWVSGSKTTASNLIVAADACAANGADIISMSLGGGTPTKLEERAFDGYYADGILSVAAAGNDNDPADETTWGVLHYPASYPSVVSVAAIDSDGLVADFSQRNDTLELSAPGVGVLSTLPYVETNLLTVDGDEYTAFHVEFSGYGSATGALVNGGLCTATEDWTGKVVLCERGLISFAEKILNVEASGGVAAVIYNNVEGDLLATMGEDSSSIVGIAITQAQGQYLVANKLGLQATVYSNIEKPASGYEAWGGTSMATPHVSAVAALLWDYCPSATNVEIRQAMVDSAAYLGEFTDYGYGLVQATDAMQALACGGGGEIDTTPPVILDVDVVVKRQKTTITWTTDEPTTGVVDIIGVGMYYSDSLSTSHSITVRISSGEYTFHIDATDAAGNTTHSVAYHLP